MNDSTDEQVVAAVQAQYEEFPYPPVASLEQEDPQRRLHASFNYDLQLAGDECLNSSSTIWVPGCGTRWAVMTALQFRDTQIVASDLSRASLTLQRRIARSLRIDNIEFRRENLLEARHDQSFDFVSCVGVLHHLPDPRTGFKIIARSLKRTGTAEIMVYDYANRQHSIRMQRIISILDPERRLDASERFGLAWRVLKAAGPQTDRPRELDRVLRLAETSTEFRRELADFISHPQENYYDVISLVTQLEEVGLTPRSWRMPHLFSPEFLLPDTELHPLFARLNATDRAQLGYLLSSWLLEAFVCRQETARHGTPTRIEGRTQVRAIDRTTIYRLDSSGELIGQEERSKLTTRDGQLWMDAGERRPAVSAYGRVVDCVLEYPRRLLALPDLSFDTALSNEEILRVVELAGSTATIDTLRDALDNEAGSVRTINHDDVRALCERLLKPPFRVLALVD